MNLHAFYHIPKSNYAAAVRTDELHLRFRAAKEDSVTVTLIHGNKFAWKKTRKEERMQLIAEDEYFSYYAASLINPDGRHAYYFRISDGTDTVYYTEAGILRHSPDSASIPGETELLEADDSKDELYYFVYPDIAPSNVLNAPDWMRDAVFYQIFVDSFARDEVSEQENQSVSWEGTVPWHTCRGGNLKGICRMLPYLQRLGINAIYLTPVFHSDSPHKYNTYDYQSIDPGFGTKEDLKKLTAAAHSLGIRVILDAVFNHCGVHFAPFEDVVKNGKASRYWNWFFIQGDQVEREPVNYRGFSFGGYMPKLNTGNPETAEYLISAAENWTRECSLDGWRLDVADEIDPEFLRSFRRRLKALQPDACIIGETWHHAAAWLQGDQFDSVMHYPFTKLMTDFFARSLIRPEVFAERINRLLMAYPDTANEVTLNFLDSHDTGRFLTTCHGDPARLKNAAAFLFAYPGMPCTYYGTEIGMDGGPDPDCRRGFPRNEECWDQELLAFYRALIILRKHSEALRRGTVTIASCHGIIALLRMTQTERLLLLVNQKETAETVDAGELTALLSRFHPELSCTLRFVPILLPDLYPSGVAESGTNCFTELLPLAGGSFRFYQLQ